ncbi:Bifunctional transcriptional activator/DNA repair enzyme Ada [Tsuneonella dongtanensis]|uniref:methylated-DNA--[protein]-cysteine S-methyltransferase n=1 Tax=Tsuneonella dongtanensis TaxID=692370 RepID=A0A1B2ADT8_9SPHN|nr:methylated-DNA--[protein]-cysteine S-methyltransferase [Tsuneonella dongtanensis]ANY20304.1 Bifunctional transcriptional activator/DNA repair enzyme Ada [Tsuneonella dongtanensis]
MTYELTDDDRWRIALAKDRRFDGHFVTGVHSTGIYCRPSCAARPPKRENVRFYASPADAEAAGLRACLRCKPGDVARDEAAVRAAIDEIKASDGLPRLEELAALTGYSPSHFQRLFTRATGLSPAAYARALREEKARSALSAGGKVTDAIYDAGYESPSRFYDAMEDKMGMNPSAWRDGGRGTRISWAVVSTTLGPMLVAATDKGVCRLSFDEGPEELSRRFPNAELVEGGTEFERLLTDVVSSVEEPGHSAHIPLDVKGTAFQEACWKALREIPPGETRTYAEIAAAAGNPKAVRAAGSANARNNVAVLIPCHRVIRTGGDLGGYAYGLDIKRELLKREGLK